MARIHLELEYVLRRAGSVCTVFWPAPTLLQGHLNLRDLPDEFILVVSDRVQTTPLTGGFDVSLELNHRPAVARESLVVAYQRPSAIQQLKVREDQLCERVVSVR